MDFREYSYTGGSVALDNVGTYADSLNPTSTIVGVTPVLSGSNDVIIQSFASGSGSATAVNTYADANIGISYYGSADLLNTTSTVPPTFTICCTNTVYAAIYIAFKLQWAHAERPLRSGPRSLINKTGLLAEAADVNL
jgi:hypothetical protein